MKETHFFLDFFLFSFSLSLSPLYSLFIWMILINDFFFLWKEIYSPYANKCDDGDGVCTYVYYKFACPLLIVLERIFNKYKMSVGKLSTHTHTNKQTRTHSHSLSQNKNKLFIIIIIAYLIKSKNHL